jgi:hypothetical protein
LTHLTFHFALPQSQVSQNNKPVEFHLRFQLWSRTSVEPFFIYVSKSKELFKKKRELTSRCSNFTGGMWSTAENQHMSVVPLQRCVY